MNNRMGPNTEPCGTPRRSRQLFNNIAMVEFDQVWFILFNIVSPALGFPWYISSHPDPPKESSTADMTSSLIRYCFPVTQVLFHVGERKIVRWCQIRKIWRVINQFKATVTHNSHWNHRLVCRSIVLVTRDSLRQFSGRFEMSLQYYFSKSWITYPVWVLSGKKKMQ